MSSIHKVGHHELARTFPAYKCVIRRAPQHEHSPSCRTGRPSQLWSSCVPAETAHVCPPCERAWTNLQRGGQYAEAVQAVVELRVRGPPEERLPELGLALGLGPPAQGADTALLTGPKQVTQGRAFTASCNTAETGGLKPHSQTKKST